LLIFVFSFRTATKISSQIWRKGIDVFKLLLYSLNLSAMQLILIDIFTIVSS